MAAVTRHVDDFVPRRRRARLVEMPHRDAVVKLVPEPRQHERDRTHEWMRIVGGDLPGEIARALARLIERDLFLERRARDRVAYGFCIEQRIDDGAPMR